MENTAQEMQPRIEAVLGVAIACGLISGAARPWLLKWLMAAIADDWGEVAEAEEFSCDPIEAEEFSRDHLILTGNASTGEPNA